MKCKHPNCPNDAVEFDNECRFHQCASSRSPGSLPVGDKLQNLLPCPFCGSPGVFEYTDYNPETGLGDDGMGYAKCSSWHCGIGLFGDHDSAIEKWNRRHSCQQPVDNS